MEVLSRRCSCDISIEREGYGRLITQICSSSCEISYFHLEHWSGKEVREYVDMYTEVYVYLWTERKGHESLITEMLMWHVNKGRVWKPYRMDIFIYLGNVEYSSRQLIRQRGAYICIDVKRDIRVLMNREHGVWRSHHRDTHVKYEQRGRGMDVRSHRYLHLYVKKPQKSESRMTRSRGAWICIDVYKDICVLMNREAGVKKSNHWDTHVTWIRRKG